MSPFQHGEVFVTEDGAETDLDLGHYERFTDVNTSARLERHRRRDLQLGHPARAPRRLPRRHRPGDPAHHRRDQEPHPAASPSRPTSTSSSPRSAARWATSSRCRSSRRCASSTSDLGRDRCMFVHLTLVPVPRPRRRAQDQADPALGPGAAPHRHPAGHGHVPLRGAARRARSARRSRCSRTCRSTSVVSARDVDSIYKVPLEFRARGRRRRRSSTTSASRPRPPDLSDWEALVERIDAATTPVRIALVGKYTQLADAYLSVIEALNHAGTHHGGQRRGALGRLRAAHRRARPSASSTTCDGILIPGGFGVRGIEGKIQRGPLRARARRAVPRHLPRACRSPSPSSPATWRAWRAPTPPSSTPRRPYPGDRPPARAEGGPRHGRHDAPGRRPGEAPRGHARPRDLRRGRHLRAPPPPLRGQQPPAQAARARRARRSAAPRPTTASSRSIELPDHPFFVASQYHPEFKSRPLRPQPLFRDFVGAALERARERAPEVEPEVRAESHA